MEPEMIVFFIPILGILLGFFGVWTAHKQKLAKLEVERLQAQAAASQGRTGEQAVQIVSSGPAKTVGGRFATRPRLSRMAPGVCTRSTRPSAFRSAASRLQLV